MPLTTPPKPLPGDADDVADVDEARPNDPVPAEDEPTDEEGPDA